MGEKVDKHYDKKEVVEKILLELHKEFGVIDLVPVLAEIKKNS